MSFINSYYGQLTERLNGRPSALEEAQQRGTISMITLLLGAAATEAQRVTLVRLLGRRFPQRASTNQYLLS